ncbi:MAG: hypothetical protein J4215_02350 [Candidatus Diapherotrites archaeon]|uniref:Lipoprotein n=1 Tax=Candidatus Iainarchaeum sp. TaxID=3101447 RepID=A0A8T4L3S3_9ARCH|nr:hypothetical protein [Candidatus Diapherotrites archaeon]
MKTALILIGLMGILLLVGCTQYSPPATGTGDDSTPQTPEAMIGQNQDSNSGSQSSRTPLTPSAEPGLEAPPSPAEPTPENIASELDDLMTDFDDVETDLK